MFDSHANPRRRLLLGLGALHLPWALPSSAANADAAFLQALAQGGCVVLLRHALTAPGIGDPPGSTLSFVALAARPANGLTTLVVLQQELSPTSYTTYEQAEAAVLSNLGLTGINTRT